MSYPATGAQKLFEVNDEHRLRIFYEKRMGAEVGAEQLGDEWKGYVLRIAGGNDKQGFPMKQGVLSHSKLSHTDTTRTLHVNITKQTSNFFFVFSLHKQLVFVCS